MILVKFSSGSAGKRLTQTKVVPKDTDVWYITNNMLSVAFAYNAAMIYDTARQKWIKQKEDTKITDEEILLAALGAKQLTINS